MAGNIFRSMFSGLSLYSPNAMNLRQIHTGTVWYAARKGTRAKARAKKVKVEVTKVGFIPHNQRGKDRSKVKLYDKQVDDTHKKVAIDDVYPMLHFRWPVYTVEDAVMAHQQTHHPTMYNQPENYVYAKVEFNMEAAKKNRFVDSFTRLSLLPHGFPREEVRTILAFCKGPEMAKEVLLAGATTVGGTEVIKKIQEGALKVNEYDYIIAHPNVLTDLVPIRGLMKRKFPNVRAGTLDPDLPTLVKKFAAGIQFRVAKDENQHNYASVEIPVGRLNMDPKQITENVAQLLKDIQAGRPKRDGLFITRCSIVCPPSNLRFKIDPFEFVDRTLSKEVQEDSDDEGEAVAAKA